MKAFTIMSSAIERCPTRNLSAGHYRADGSCLHTARALACDGSNWGPCSTPPITHLDSKGYIYCTAHGLRRRDGGIPCRKLRPAELKKLERGETLPRY